MGASTLIAIDWGTTSARAYRMDTRGDVREERAAALGISQIAGGRYDELMARFGRPMPAVGVSLDLDTIAEVPS